MTTKKTTPPKQAEDVVTKDDLANLKEDIVKTTSGTMKQMLMQWFSRNNVQEVVNEAIKQGRPVKLDELGEQQPIELVAANDIVKPGELDAFMEEFVRVYVYPDAGEGKLHVVCPQVNGINQPIVRGYEQDVKRKYIEAMARSKVTDYAPMQPNFKNPEDMAMIPMTNLTAQFEVRGDSDKGQRWLAAILAEKG